MGMLKTKQVYCKSRGVQFNRPIDQLNDDGRTDKYVCQRAISINQLHDHHRVQSVVKRRRY